MSASNQLPPIIVILGATAVGKTALAVNLAKRVNGEIISVDSRLFYRGMDIGTAKPTLEERGNIPHHLIDVADPDEVWSLAKFQVAAKSLITEIHGRGKLPICVGGTGQYIAAITEGWVIPELTEDLALRTILSNWAEDIGPQGLHDRLRVIDPAAADKIDMQNMRRTIRALEVIFKTGNMFSTQRKKTKIHYRVLQIGLARPRNEIYARVEDRLGQMIKAGFLSEVENLLDKYPPDLRSFSAIGYKQLIAHIQGEFTLEEALENIVRKTKLFVRRQNTWFKPNDPLITWFNVGENVLVEIEKKVQGFIE